VSIQDSSSFCSCEKSYIDQNEYITRRTLQVVEVDEEITADKLRAILDVMPCGLDKAKRVLTECHGDVKVAIEYLRVSGLAFSINLEYQTLEQYAFRNVYPILPE
jgi:hypothetical protein